MTLPFGTLSDKLEQMLKDILRQLVAQHKITCAFTFDRVSEENASYRLNPDAASVGFIFHHLAETLNRFGNFLGVPSEVQNSTIGHQDQGQAYDLAASRRLLAAGYAMLEQVIENTTEEEWLQPVETPFFGPVPKVRMFGHALFHTSHHAGQISLTLARASKLQ